MKKKDFLNNLAEAIQKVNCPYFVTPGEVNPSLFVEMGLEFSSSTFVIFHNNQIGYDEILVCFDEKDNVIAAKITNPTEVFLIALNITKLLYKVPIRSCKVSPNEVVVILKKE